MDHAGDIAYKIGRGYQTHPWNRSDRITGPVILEPREKYVLVVFSADGGAFRVTVEDVGHEGLTEDELYLPTMPTDTVRTPG